MPSCSKNSTGQLYSQTFKHVTYMKSTIMLIVGIAVAILLAGLVQKQVKALNPNA